ncbi:glycosyltransferase family 1 protein [Granulicella sp. dw_53]|uniref:glycosyltransferase family 4 protein n=1 Tax=Granulicella sp. dw_53 TaxID=2719792 RepID=UPI001BD2872E|nr:glycosyltransferase family 1 protein [Granulicella sp. dw_53]
MTLLQRSAVVHDHSLTTNYEGQDRSHLRVVVAIVSSSEFLSGVSRHAVNMVRCLLTRTEVIEIHLIAAEWQYQSLRNALPQPDRRLHLHIVSLGRSALSRNLWYYQKLPILAEQLKADVVHLAYPSPLNKHAFRCPTIVTLHDLYPYDIPENFGFPKVFFNRAVLRQCLGAADAIACVSESTLRRLDIYSPQHALEKAVTIYNCVEAGPPIAAESPLPNWNGERFLLCVAQHRRNKNIPLVIEVFRRLLAKGDIGPTTLLAIIGIEGPETARIHQAIDDAGLARQVMLLHGVSDAELQWCYRHCELLLSASVTEGFGLPIVEAMLQHCRVVCSDIPAFREVGGSYCHYVPLHRAAEDGFVEAIRVALRSIKFRASTTERFSAPQIAEAYLQLYSELRLAPLRPVFAAVASWSGLWKRKENNHEHM